MTGSAREVWTAGLGMLSRHRRVLLRLVLPIFLGWCLVLYLVNLSAWGRLTVRDLARQIAFGDMPVAEYPWAAQGGVFLLWWIILPALAVMLHRLLLDRAPLWPGWRVLLRYVLCLVGIGVFAYLIAVAVFTAMGMTWLIWKEGQLPLVRVRHTRVSHIFFLWMFLLPAPLLVYVALEEQLPRIRVLMQWCVKMALPAFLIAVVMYFESEFVQTVGRPILRDIGTAAVLAFLAFVQAWKLVLAHLYVTAVYRARTGRLAVKGEFS